MLSYEESLKILKETDALLEGHFILSSGLHSNKYIQCAKLLSHPAKSEKICSSLCEKIKSNFKKIDIILSPAIGGIVVGYEVARQLNTRAIFSERVDGKMFLRRGFNIPENSNVLIVEDVITTGKSVLECSKIVKSSKSQLLGYACLINRFSKDLLNEEKIVSQIKFKIDTFKNNELPESLKNITPTEPGSRNLNKWKKKDLV